MVILLHFFPKKHFHMSMSICHPQLLPTEGQSNIITTTRGQFAPSAIIVLPGVLTTAYL